MSEQKVCGTCQWHHPDGAGDWVCVNADCYYCGDWTEYMGTCDYYEER